MSYTRKPRKYRGSSQPVTRRSTSNPFEVLGTLDSTPPAPTTPPPAPAPTIPPPAPKKKHRTRTMPLGEWLARTATPASSSRGARVRRKVLPRRGKATKVEEPETELPDELKEFLATKPTDTPTTAWKGGYQAVIAAAHLPDPAIATREEKERRKALIRQYQTAIVEEEEGPDELLEHAGLADLAPTGTKKRGRSKGGRHKGMEAETLDWLTLGASIVISKEHGHNILIQHEEEPLPPAPHHSSKSEDEWEHAADGAPDEWDDERWDDERWEGEDAPSPDPGDAHTVDDWWDREC